jgi:hypothetical protein
MLIILLEIRVEEIYDSPADEQAPCLKVDRTVPDLDRVEKSTATFRGDKFQGKSHRIIAGIGFLLPAIGTDLLLKVAVSVQKAYSNEGNAEIARRLCVVA